MTASPTLAIEAARSRAAAEIGIAAIGLGLLADLVFREQALGLNAPLWIGALLLVLGYTGRHRAASPQPVELACLLLSFAAASALAWRASPALQALLFLASGGYLVLAVVVRSGLPWRRAGVAMLAGALIAAGIAILAGIYRVQSSVRPQSESLRRSKEGAGTALRTAAIAVPVLLVFALLFASADAVFEDGLTRLLDFDLSRVIPHVFWLTVGAWFAGGVLWAQFEGHLIAVPQPALPDARRLKPVEVGVTLGALAVLFAAFVAVQLRYLFGGHDLVQQTTGLTYAEYARRGFFELALASALLLPLLLLADWARRRGARADAVYRVLAGLLVVLLLVIMASALERMRVYEQAYGLTEARLYVVAFLCWLALVFALFLRTVVASRNDWFVAGSIATVGVLLATLTALGPDAVIAERNVARASEVHPFDAEYAARLGADAAPVLIRHIEQLAPADSCTVARSLLERWGDGSGDDIRSWNWSRAQAARSVARASETLGRACEASP